MRVVSFHYVLKNKSGELLDSSSGGEPMTYLEGSGQIIPGLESQLKSCASGDKKKVEVKAKDAYGEKDSELAFDVPRTQFPPNEDIQVGMQFKIGGPGSDQEASPVFTVVKTSATHVSVDGNHPLAGQDLFFDVEIVEIRAATPEELSHGHAHGRGGHHHH
ncbi:MAG TPA: peptidylprolyl isomerase [Oligoflexia bacterium]|nr:peptidylprolyl isomerase [Oligoflexia bacterium]